MLQTVGKYCFQPSTFEKVEKICKAAVGVLPDVTGPVGDSAVVPGESGVREGPDSQDAVTGKVWFTSPAISIQHFMKVACRVVQGYTIWYKVYVIANS